LALKAEADRLPTPRLIVASLLKKRKETPSVHQGLIYMRLRLSKAAGGGLGAKMGVQQAGVGANDRFPEATSAERVTTLPGIWFHVKT
jgi:hypothetical protein